MMNYMPISIKRNYISLQGTAVVLLFILLISHSFVSNAESWHLVHDEQGVQVYWQTIAGSDIPKSRSQMTVTTTIEKLLVVLDDIAGYKNWMYSCQEAKLLGKEGDKTYVYTAFSAPWPVSPRDSVSYFTLKHTPEHKQWQVEVVNQADKLKPRQGYVRMPKLQARWTVHAINPSQLRITYELHMELGGSVPSWLAQERSWQIPFYSLVNLRKMLE